jgi:alcohol dehydrogenase
MKTFDFSVPTRVFFGNGEIKRLQEIASTIGKRAMLLAAKRTMKETGILDRAVNLLRKGGVDVIVSDDVDPNPKDVDIDRQARTFLQEKCDFTVGLGGGSSMDSAKAVAFLAAQGGGTILDYLAGGPHATLEGTKPAFPIICVTTTAGTGSETTPWWVITNTTCHEKPGTGNDSTMARFAIVDPELMVSLPREVTRNTGIDVLFHAMEAFIANVATPFTDLFAREAIRLVVDNLGTAIERGSDLEARSRMAWANSIAGIAIGEGKSSTVGIHALGHSVGGQTDAPHGLTMAAVGPAYMLKTWDADIARYAEITRLLGGAKPGLSDQELARRSPEALVAVLEKFGCRVRMRDLGVREEMITAMTDSAIKTMSGCLNCSLKPLDRAEIIQMYKDSF